jgi:hypothetical protein
LKKGDLEPSEALRLASNDKIGTKHGYFFVYHIQGHENKEKELGTTGGCAFYIEKRNMKEELLFQIQHHHHPCHECWASAFVVANVK